MRPPPVQSTMDEDLRAPGALKRKLQAEYDRSAQIVLAGNSFKTFEDYRYAVGKLYGIKLALDACDETMKELGQR